MKKHLLLLFALLLGALAAQAQVTEFPYTANFEDNSWTLISNDEEMANDWEVMSDYYGGSYLHAQSFEIEDYSSWPYEYNYIGADEWAISPAVSINATALVFEASINGQFYPGSHIQVYVASTNTIADFLTSSPVVDTIADYTFSLTMPLDAYFGQTVYIAVRFTAGDDEESEVYFNSAVIRSLNVPIVEAPNDTIVDIDTAITFTGHLVQASDSLLVFTWTSTMAAADLADMEFTDSVCTITYAAAGIDTLVFTATNAFGTHSDMVIVRAVNLSPYPEMPYTTSFEEEQDTSWFFINGPANKWYIDTAVSYTGERALYISGDEGSTNDYAWADENCEYDADGNYICETTVHGTSYAIRAITIPDTGNYTYSYRWHCGGSGYSYSDYSYAYDYMGVYLVSNLNYTFDTEEQYYYLDYSWMPLCNDDLWNQTEWQNESGTFYAGENLVGTAYLIVLWHNSGYEYDDHFNPGAAIDDIVIMPTSCSAPAYVNATAVTTTTATIGWIAGGEEEQWVYSLDGNTWDSISTNPYTITGLNPGSIYTVYLRAVCGEGDTSVSTSTDFVTECTPITTLPWTEDFQNAPMGYQFIPCWNRGNNLGYGNYPEVSNDYDDPAGINKYLYFSSYSNYWCYAILPTFAADYDTLEMTFEAYNYSPASVTIGLINTDYYHDSIPFDTVAVIQITNNSFTEYTVSFAGHNGAGRRILILANGNYFNFDNVTISPVGSCIKPANLTLTTATSNSLSVAWSANGSDATQWDVRYRVSGSTNAWQSVQPTDTIATLTGLFDATPYDIEVRTICAPGDTSYSFARTFRTACLPVTNLPYFEGFNDDSRDCWTTMGASTSSSVQWHYENNSWNSFDGSYYAYSGYVYDASPCDEWFISPAIEIPPTNAENISLLWYGLNSPYGTDYDPYVVLLSTSATIDTATFTDTLAHIISNQDWTKYSVNLGQYAGQTIHIAFRHYTSYNGGGVYIDNVEVRESLEPQLVLAGETVANTGSPNTITAQLSEGSTEGLHFSWTSNMLAAGQATATANADSSALTFIYNIGGEDTIRTIVTNNYGTDTAYLYVTARDLHFMTLPYTTGFEPNDDNSDWLMVNDSNAWYIGTAVNNGGTQALYVSNDGGNTNHYAKVTSYSYFYRGITIPDSGDYAINFDWRCKGMNANSSYPSAYMDVFLTGANEVFDGYYDSYSSDFYLSLSPYNSEYYQSGFFSTDTLWHNYVTTFTAEPGEYILVFHWYNYNYESPVNPPAAVDNLIVKHVTCPAPSELELTDLDEHSVAFEWTSNGSEEAWEVIFGDNDPVVVTETEYSISGLTPHTHYDIRVRAICGEGDTSFALIGSVTTECAPVTELPWVEDFDSYAPSSNETEIDCWLHIGGGRLTINRPNSLTGESSDRALRFYRTSSDNVDNVAVLPYFYPTVTALEVSFYAKPSDYEAGNLEVGYLTDATNTLSFQALATLEADDSVYLDSTGYSYVYQLHNVSLEEAPDGARIALRQQVGDIHYGYWFVDSLVVSIREGVDPYACDIPDNIAVLAATENIATVNWDGSAASWELKLVNGTDTSLRTVAGRPYVISGLTSCTDYSVSMRAICSSSAESEWSDFIDFTTGGCDTTDTNGIRRAENVAFSLYPNPATSSVTIDANGMGQAQVNVIDLNGSIVISTTIDNEPLHIDLSTLARGAYFVRLTNQNGTSVRKLIVQ